MMKTLIAALALPLSATATNGEPLPLPKPAGPVAVALRGTRQADRSMRHRRGLAKRKCLPRLSRMRLPFLPKLPDLGVIVLAVAGRHRQRYGDQKTGSQRGYSERLRPYAD
jgi:hypothetical protein